MAVAATQRRSAEYVELEDPGEELALPGERWCDVVHRRGRYGRQFEMLSDATRSWSIDDAITENLALPDLLRDYMSQLRDAAECQSAFEVLRSLTVCDPTVGSGAFLFAAIDVLEPLYSEVLARAEELVTDGQDGPEFLTEAQSHPNPRYWLIKTICLRNLFGVDLMHEAPEIAKLRLFLKLAAQIDRVEDLEPLPDLDFNIKCGNLLVGIADEYDFQERLGGTLEAAARLDDIKALAVEVAAVYEEFVADQAEAADGDTADRKQVLTARFDEARERCHELLHDVRGTTSFGQWIESHQPFHWFVEFPSVWQNDGFDVVIGNPPYIKKSLVTDYTWFGYKTEKCPDLYALCMERATTLVNDKGRFAMIVAHSLCFSGGFSSLRGHLDSAFGCIWTSSYAKRPSLLFAGSADVRNSILVAKWKGSHHRQLFATGCRRWQTVARDGLFDSLNYAPVPPILSEQLAQWPFLDREISASYESLSSGNRPIQQSFSRDRSDGPTVSFKTVARYFLSVFVDPPPTVDPISGQPVATKSKRTGLLWFGTEASRDLALLMLAGRWGYLWWMIYGDEFHVTRSTLAAFPGDIERLTMRTSGDMELATLLDLSKALQSEMPEHLAWQINAGVKVGRYNMLKLRHLTDRPIGFWLRRGVWTRKRSRRRAICVTGWYSGTRSSCLDAESPCHL